MVFSFCLIHLSSSLVSVLSLTPMRMCEYDLACSCMFVFVLQSNKSSSSKYTHNKYIQSTRRRLYFSLLFQVHTQSERRERLAHRTELSWSSTPASIEWASERANEWQFIYVHPAYRIHWWMLHAKISEWEKNNQQQTKLN